MAGSLEGVAAGRSAVVAAAVIWGMSRANG